MNVLQRIFGRGKAQSLSNQSQPRREAPAPSSPLPKAAESSRNDVHDAARKGEAARLPKAAEWGRECLVCGAPLRKGAPLTLSCSNGHTKISYYSFDNTYATLSIAIASSLKDKGYRVEKSAEGDHYNITT